MIKKFKKKPVIIEALKITGSDKNLDELIDFMGHSFEGASMNTKNKTAQVYIKTLEGTMTAKQGDYVIKGIKGEFYSCRGDIFKKSYEAIK